VLKVELPDVRNELGVETATRVACATGGGVLEPPQAATSAATEIEAAESSHRFEMKFMRVSK
jgi:hypothetical protein